MISEKKDFFLRTLQWTIRMQFWHPRRKLFDNAKQFRSGVQKRNKKFKFCRKNVFLQVIFEYIEFSFANPAKKNIHQTAENFSLILQEDQKNCLLLLKMLLLTSRRQY